jgi:thioredoxin-dependent peroxiredoxin
MIVSLFSFFFQACNGQGKSLMVGDPVPVFSLHDQNDSLFNSKDHVGSEILVIFFYPKDESSVCTKEACSFRDSFNDFVKVGALVIGINSGTIESHSQFALNHQLPFTLLSDPGNKVLKMFGVKNKFIFTGRETFVVDKTGKIVFTFDSFTNGTAHEKEALAFIKNRLAKS